MYERGSSAPPTVYPLADLRPPLQQFPTRVGSLNGISNDGRYLTYTLVFSGTYNHGEVGVRLDRTTGTHLVVFAYESFNQSRRLWGSLSVSRDGRTFSWIETDFSPTGTGSQVERVMLRRASEPEAVAIGTTCIVSGVPCTLGPAVTGDGYRVLYAAGATTPEALVSYEIAIPPGTYWPETPTGVKTYYPQVKPFGALITSTNGAMTLVTRGNDGRPILFDRARGRVDTLTVAGNAIGLSDNALVLVDSPAAVLDWRSGLTFPLGAGLRALAIDAYGRHVVVARDLGNAEQALEVLSLDADNDSMLDAWETLFGLDPANPNDTYADADGDGVSNLIEFLGRTHPQATFSRLLAEGASGAFYDTVTSIFNPGDQPTTVAVHFLGANLTTASRVFMLPAKGRHDVASCCVPTLDATEFSLLIESDRPVVADRRMTWDRAAGYGSHASTSVAAPAQEWYFAEGATIAGMQTFFLLQNPGLTDASVTIDYLTQGAGVSSSTYLVKARSRRTVWVNVEGVNNAEFASIVRSSVPIVAERAMYRDGAGRTFAAGTNAIGATAPAQSWSFAEGATGDFFDTFVLIGNPGLAPAQVTAQFRTSVGGVPTTITRHYEVPPQGRHTIWLDYEDSQLANVEVSTVITSDVPVVAERTMWWPGTPDTWTEAHVEFGAVGTATRWAIADAEEDAATDTQTYLLVDATLTSASGSARVTAYPTSGPPVSTDVVLVEGRNTLALHDLFPGLSGRVSVIVESLSGGGSPAELTVEKAIYRHNFESGAASLATPLP